MGKYALKRSSRVLKGFLIKQTCLAEFTLIPSTVYISAETRLNGPSFCFIAGMNPWEIRGKYILPHRFKLKICSGFDHIFVSNAFHASFKSNADAHFQTHVQTETLRYCINQSVDLKRTLTKGADPHRVPRFTKIGQIF